MEIFTIGIVSAVDIEEKIKKIEALFAGAKTDGEVSISGSADTEGNKSAEVEVDISNKGGTISGSVSGSISQDKGGNTSGKAEVKGTMHF